MPCQALVKCGTVTIEKQGAAPLAVRQRELGHVEQLETGGGGCRDNVATYQDVGRALTR